MLPPGITARVSVEQASIFGWGRYVGLTGAVIGMRTFGASAPLKELQKQFGFTPRRLSRRRRISSRSVGVTNFPSHHRYPGVSRRMGNNASSSSSSAGPGAERQF